MQPDASRLDVRAVRRIAREAQASCDPGGQADEALSGYLQALDSSCSFSPGARALFDDLLARVGVASIHPPGLPLNSEPFWFRGGHPLAGFRSAATPPGSVDVVI